MRDKEKGKKRPTPTRSMQPNELNTGYWGAKMKRLKGQLETNIPVSF